jgi:hypothetical protein
MGYGSTRFNLQRPTVVSQRCTTDPAKDTSNHDVALQVAFERQTLKPAFSLDRL